MHFANKSKLIKTILVSFVLGLITLSFVAQADSSSKQLSNTPSNQLASDLSEKFDNNRNELITKERQLTFVGPRSGEGYFSADGKKMIFQSERENGNPFYQMYILDLTTGESHRISTGKGKTTCGWISPDGKKAMWSSTHLDKKTNDKVKAEHEERAKPVKGRYSWSFDDQFDIFSSDLKGKNLKRLTKEKGYDAEGSYSSDGKWIAFASNRSAYEGKLDDEDQKKFQQDPSYFMEIYIMKADGTQVKRLTNAPGYDGGPFFSADAKKITWRRFNADGSKAEIYTMNIDGSEQKQVTHLGSMSWAPFYHPSGDYIVFGSSVLGFSNFELFIVDSEGKHKPVRVTFADGFDGLASFSPDGKQITWSHRNEKGDSQILLANWNDAEARKLLGLDAKPETQVDSLQKKSNIHLPADDLSQTTPDDVKKIVNYLASDEMKGRLTGSAEEKIYTEEMSKRFQNWGLKPAFGNSYIQTFEFTTNVRATDKNTANLNGRMTEKLVLGEDYQVFSFSKTGEFRAAPMVFAGFGIKTSATDKFPAYDSFKDLDLNGKWVVVLSGVPDIENKDFKLHLLTFARPQHKITMAKNAGALGVIFISETEVKNLKFEGSQSESGIPALKISKNLANKIIENVKLAQPIKNFDELLSYYQKSADDKKISAPPGFNFDSLYFQANIDLVPEKATGRNVIAILEPELKTKTKKNSSKALLIGAHMDHLGTGESTGSSLARAEEKGQVHYGADDNASGVSGVLELARTLSSIEERKKLKRPIYFALWSGEEIGVLGSSYFVKTWKEQNKKEFRDSFVAGLNMDMIGRLRDSLQVQGIASAKEWPALSESIAIQSRMNLSLTADPYLPTDSMSLYLGEIPSITFFTGSHAEYHSPRDQAETLNYPGLVDVINVVKRYALKIAESDKSILTYEKVPGNSGQKLEGRSFRIYLGTIPDYSQEGVKGVRISGASKDSPAEKAGLKAGDIIVEFDKTKIENLYDYVYSLQAAKANAATLIKVHRGGETLNLQIVPKLKE